jgi:hypothetical protein
VGSAANRTRLFKQTTSNASISGCMSDRMFYPGRVSHHFRSPRKFTHLIAVGYFKAERSTRGRIKAMADIVLHVAIFDHRNWCPQVRQVAMRSSQREMHTDPIILKGSIHLGDTTLQSSYIRTIDLPKITPILPDHSDENSTDWHKLISLDERTTYKVVHDDQRTSLSLRDPLCSRENHYALPIQEVVCSIISTQTAQNIFCSVVDIAAGTFANVLRLRVPKCPRRPFNKSTHARGIVLDPQGRETAADGAVMGSIIVWLLRFCTAI